MPLCLWVTQQQEQILQQVALLLHEEQADLARGLTTGRFDREDSIRLRRRHRRITSVVLTWLQHRQGFERSSAFARPALVADIRNGSQSVDTVYEANGRASVLGEVVQVLQEQQVNTAAASAGGTLQQRSCAAEAAATANDLCRPGDPRLQPSTSSTVTPERRRAFCLVGVGRERPGKRARTLPPRTSQGTPHPRTATSKSAVQSAIDSADELIAGEDITNEEVGLVAEGIPLTNEECKALRESQLLSPPAGSVDFGPRSDCGSEDSDCADSSSCSDLDC